MKKNFTYLIFFILLCGVLHAQNMPFDSVGYRDLQVGTMTLKADTWIIRTNDGQDYLPTWLPEDFKKEGQKVVFAGAIGRIPENVRMKGTPINCSTLRKLYKSKPNPNGQQTEEKHESDSIDSVGFIRNGVGKVIQIGDTWLIEVNENNSTTRYYDELLPADFREKDLTVTFSGVIGKPAPNVRMMGLPFHITELAAVKDVDLDPSKIQEPMKNIIIDSTGYLNQATGIIKLLSSDPPVYCIEVTKNGSMVRYIPAAIPDEFKNDGEKVRVTGTIGKTPANVKMKGIPFAIKSIEKTQ